MERKGNEKKRGQKQKEKKKEINTTNHTIIRPIRKKYSERRSTVDTETKTKNKVKRKKK